MNIVVWLLLAMAVVTASGAVVSFLSILSIALSSYIRDKRKQNIK